MRDGLVVLVRGDLKKALSAFKRRSSALQSEIARRGTAKKGVKKRAKTRRAEKVKRRSEQRSAKAELQVFV